jgi:hypothetical protein
VAGLDRVGLIFVHDASDPLHIDRDVHPHDVSSDYAASEYRGTAMNAPSWALICATVTFACAAPSDRPHEKSIQEGRTYTAWLYSSEYNKLWDRFSPEMRQTFGSVADLASFASRAVKHLGTEQGNVDEQVNDAESYRVYSRSASFDKSRHRMLIEWSLAKDGAVTGLVVRPVVADSNPQ